MDEDRAHELYVLFKKTDAAAKQKQVGRRTGAEARREQACMAALAGAPWGRCPRQQHIWAH